MIALFTNINILTLTVAERSCFAMLASIRARFFKLCWLLSREYDFWHVNFTMTIIHLYRQNVMNSAVDVVARSPTVSLFVRISVHHIPVLCENR